MSELLPPIPTPRRYETIDIAKGIAIILVVVGHYTYSHSPELFTKIVDVIYLFHMPLFMFASGFLYQATKKPIPYATFIRRKFTRLMIPYFVMSLLIILFKFLSSRYVEIDNPVGPSAFLEMFYKPVAGYFLWFIWALWWMMVIAPLFNSAKRHALLLAISIALYFLSPFLTETFCIKQFAWMMIYFTLGISTSRCLSKLNHQKYSPLIFPSATIIFILLSWGFLSGKLCGFESIPLRLITLIASLSGLSTFLFISRFIRHYSLKRIRNYIIVVANYSYIIYLFHTTFEGFFKTILYKLHWFDNNPQSLYFWIGALTVVSLSTITPIVLSKFLLGRWELTSVLFGAPYIPKTFTPTIQLK